MKNIIIFLSIFLCNFLSSAQTSTKQTAASAFEGIVYSQTSFPGHPINSLLKQIDFNKGEIDRQYKSLRQRISDDPAVVNDPMYLMALVLMPVSAKTIFSPQKTFTQIQALGYEWQTIIDDKEGKARLFLQSHNMNERGTINFNPSELGKIWEKEEIGEYEGEYNEKTSAETAIIAGYPTKKITYVFSGTSQGPAASSKMVSTIPWKITLWYSDVLDPRINIQNPFYYKLNKAVLKTEVEFDKEGKKKMLYEVIKIEPKKVKEEEFRIPELGEVVNHQPGSMEALMLIMRVMTEAGKISWQ